MPSPDRPLYVIVHHGRHRHPTMDLSTEQVHDVHPDDSLADITERATELQALAARSGRPDDTYRVAELRFVDEEKP